MRFLAGGVALNDTDLTRAVSGLQRSLRVDVRERDRVLFVDSDPHAFVQGVLASELVGMPFFIGSGQSPANAPKGVNFSSAGTANVMGKVSARSLWDYQARALFTTSGSTGAPKTIVHSAQGMQYQAAATAEALALNGDHRLGVALPLNHAYGFSVVNLWLRLRSVLEVFPLTRPRAIIEALVEKRIDTLDTIPRVWSYLASAAERDPILQKALADLHVRGVGGQLLSRNLAQRFEALDASLHDGYGLTEAGPNVSINASQGFILGSVGAPLEGTNIQISATDEILVDSPSVARSHWDGELRAIPQVDSNGWLHTGDQGRLDRGHLWVHGRTSTGIQRNGMKVAVEVLEDILSAQLPSGAVVLVARIPGAETVSGDALVAVVYPGDRQRGRRDLVEIVRSNRTNLPQGFGIDAYMAADDIEAPYLASGKVDRSALANAAAIQTERI